MSYSPLVTIVIPVYNGEKYLEAAIQSALAQTYGNIEILVVSDGSNDRSEEIARRFEPRIRFLKKKNGGVSSALNLALKEMNGKWLSWLSHDDVYYAEKVETQIVGIEKYAREHNIAPEDVVCCCANDRIDARGNHVKRRPRLSPNFDSAQDALIYQIGNYSICGCCVLASKRLYCEMGGFNEENRTCSDAELWYRMMLKGHNFYFMDNVLVHSRQHKGMVSTQKEDLCRQEGSWLHEQILDEYINAYGKDNLIALSEAFARRGYYDVAKKTIGLLDKNYGSEGKRLEKKIKAYKTKARLRSIARIIYRKLFFR